MKNTKKKNDQPDKSIRENSMTPLGKNNSARKKIKIGKEEYEEDNSMNIRMKPQPLKKDKKNNLPKDK